MALKVYYLDTTTGKKVLGDVSGGIIVPAGEIIPANSFVYLKDVSGTYKAFAAKVATYDERAVMFCGSGATAADENILVVGNGSIVTITGLTASASNDCFLSLTGTIVAAPDAATTSGNIIQKVGTKVGTDVLLVGIEEAGELQ